MMPHDLVIRDGLVVNGRPVTQEDRLPEPGAGRGVGRRLRAS